MTHCHLYATMDPCEPDTPDKRLVQAVVLKTQGCMHQQGWWSLDERIQAVQSLAYGIALELELMSLLLLVSDSWRPSFACMSLERLPLNLSA